MKIRVMGTTSLLTQTCCYNSSMNDQLDWDDHDAQFEPTASDGAANQPDGSRFQGVNFHPASVKNSTSGAGAVQQPTHAAQADDGNQDRSEDWPPYGAVVLTTDEARLYLYQHHDIFLRERYTQRLVTDYEKLIGRRVPKDGGGVELQITQASLDEYAQANPQKKNAKDTPLNPEDKLFDDFRRLAAEKGYNVPIDGDVRTRPHPPAPDSNISGSDRPAAQDQKPATEPTVSHPPTPDQETVPAFWYKEALEREKRAIDRYHQVQDINIKLYETLDTTHNRLIDTQKQLTAIATTVANKIEGSTEILKGISDVFRSSKSSDDHRPPIPMDTTGDSRSTDYDTGGV